MTPDPNIIESSSDVRRLRQAFAFAAGFALLLWLIQLGGMALDLHLAGYALYPRRVDALSGILLSPLLHGSVAHLLANTPAVLILGTVLGYGYPRSARVAMPVIWIGAGIAVWLFARPAFHLGASGLTFGAMFFIFTLGVLRWDRRAIALALSVFLLYGGMIWGIFPSDPDVSFEYHLAGASLGILLAVLLKGRDPPPPRKTYAWEGEDADPDDWPFDDPPRQP